MANELLLLFTALFSAVIVFLAGRFKGVAFLYGSIALNLILVSIFGAKLIDVFGFTTNAGNIFYMSVFLATHFLLERTDAHKARRSIWIAAVSVLAFAVCAQLGVALVGAMPGDSLSASMTQVFSVSLRVVLASLLAFVFAQEVNITLYSWMQQHAERLPLGLRSVCANGAAQLIDSCIFFTIAFIDISGMVLVQAILVGWVIKSIALVIGVPFLYIDRILLTERRS